MTAPTLPAWLTLTGTHPGPWSIDGTVPAGTNSYPVVLRLTDNASTPNLYTEQSFTIFAGGAKGRPTAFGFSGFAMSG